MAEELKKHGVIPDVIETPWKEALSVKFPLKNVEADHRNELTPTEVRKKPELSWSAEEGSFYVVCMTDPDAPSRKDPKAREWLHWLVGNVPGHSVKQGTAIADYVGSAPPKDHTDTNMLWPNFLYPNVKPNLQRPYILSDLSQPSIRCLETDLESDRSGLHRYVLLVYKQPRKLTFDEKIIPATSGAGRARFTITKFAKKYELGDPVAGNFFQAQWDTTADSIHKSLK